MQDFRKLDVWQLARRLTKSIYELTRIFPASEEFGLKAQMRRASVSIAQTSPKDVAGGETANLGGSWTLPWARLASSNAKRFSAVTWHSSLKQYRNRPWTRSSKSSGCLVDSWAGSTGDRRVRQS